MNQYFLLDIPRGKAYQQHLPAMMKLLRILYPAQDETSLWNNQRTCDELNDAIDNYLKRKLKRNTADLCLDEYVKFFSDGEFNIQNLNFKQSVTIIVANERIIRKHIEEQCKNSATQRQEKATNDTKNGCSILGIIISILKKLFGNTHSSSRSKRVNSNIPLTIKEAYEILELLKASHEVNNFV